MPKSPLLLPIIMMATLGVFATNVMAQCYDGSTAWYLVHHVRRTASNNVESLAGAQVVGDYYYDWNAQVTSAVTTNPSGGHSGSKSVGYGGNDQPGISGTYAHVVWEDQPSTVGTGTYTLAVSTAWNDESPCSDSQSLTLSPNDSLTVSQPTISGLFSGNAFWNLGPGTSDPQATTTGNYYQSVSLTFNSNCNPGEPCTDTPAWSLSTTNNQTSLSATSGSTVTLQKGSTLGDCQYHSTLSASIGGLSSANYSIAVNSPGSLSHTTETTGAWGTGYTTYWSFEVLDVCTPAHNVLLPVPISEDFPGSPAFSDENGGSGYYHVTPDNWDYTDWATSSTFIDEIGQNGPAPSPAVYFDVTGPPYTGNTVYLMGAHTFNAGSMTTGNGTPVYTSGNIRYFADHGDNNP